MKDLLKLPSRTTKPRQSGITHVLDRGLSVAEVDGMVEVAGDYVDFVKLGWGTAVATGNLEAKLDRYRAHAIPVMFGGTLTEIAIAQNRLDALVAKLHELGLEHIELSDGTINLDHDRKLELIRSLAKEFTVLSEVGSKDDTRIMAPFRWVQQIESELEAGAWKVIAEARESGSVGIFRHDGEVRQGLVDEILHAVDGSQLLFEAPRKEQQVWFVRRLGPDVNLGNIAPEEVLSLETVRVGLRADTAVAVPEDAGPVVERLAMATELEGVILARHGETNDNLPPGRFQGWTDTPLNDLGRRQAWELGRTLAQRSEPIASLWASDLSRTRETAALAGAPLGLRPLLDWRLREGYRGRWERFAFSEIKESEPEPYAAWRRADPGFAFPGGESLQDLQDRVLAGLRDVHRRGPLPALVVCHGGVIRVMRCWQDGKPLTAFWEFDVPNVAVVSL